MRVQIVYTSCTGNTEKLAESIFEAVPVKEKNVKRIEERTERDDGDLYLVGFWTDRGTASPEILDLLGVCTGKRLHFLVPAVWEMIRSITKELRAEWLHSYRRIVSISEHFSVRVRCRYRCADAMKRCVFHPMKHRSIA